MEEAKPIVDVKFEHFLLRDHYDPKVVNILPNINPADPLALLDLFIPPRIYAIIIENTNSYTIVKNVSITRSSTNIRYQQPTDENEIRVLFGILFYISIHKEPNYKVYQEIPKPNGPIHALLNHMSLNRYENLRRYLHISPLKLMEPQEPLEPLDKAQNTPKDLEDLEHWWQRLEPMLSTFRTTCRLYLIPGTEVAIDEIMVRFFGRSSDTCKMPNKPIKQGYKIFALADDGYIWHFQLSSRQYGITELEKVDELTLIGSMVLQMARLLPKFLNSYYVIYIDNYFTSIPLFSMLHRENIGIARTTRASGIDFPTLLTVLHKNWSTKLDWGTTITDVVDNVLCIGWQDNNFVLGLSIVHTVHEASSQVSSKHNRPSSTSTNAGITREVFGDLPFMDLKILTFIDDYNHNMNSVDLANQHRQPYDTQQITYQTQVLLLHWILDQAAMDAYKLTIIGKTWPKDHHLEFRWALYRKLLDLSKLIDS